MLQNFRTLFNTQPIPGTEPELFDAFDSANPGSQLGAQQTGVGGLVGQAAHGCKLLVDGVGGQMPRFQVHAIAHDHDPVEGQPWLGATPCDELIDLLIFDSPLRRTRKNRKSLRLMATMSRAASLGETSRLRSSSERHDVD